MVRGSRRPGPARSSCLTCRRRHKKCDQRQPTCERCELGGFECLGYAHDEPSHIRGSISVTQVARPTRRILPKAISPSSHPIPSEFRIGRPPLNDSPSERGQLKDATPTSPSLESFTSINLSVSAKSTVATGSPVSVLRQIIDFYSPGSTPDPLKTFADGQWLIDTIIARMEKVVALWYFKPINYQMEHFRQDINRRLRKSKFTRWITLVGTSVLDSFIAGDASRDHLHFTWLEYIEGSLKRELGLDLVPHELLDRRGAWVHVSLMKTRLIHSSGSYRLLRGITPAFLQVVYSNPVLWPADCDFTRIPLYSILASKFHELIIFTLIDCTHAMAFGLPQQVEYDTTTYSKPSSSVHQWAHSSPTEFILLLVDINTCRDKSPAARDWRDIEQQLLSWQSRPGEHVFVESWMAVAWYAVQESWRLALLVYLYLAVCNISSDDPRIQPRVKQILQVVGTVKKREPSDGSVSFFFQYLIAGICALSEAHRRIVRDKLTSADETKLWLMRSPDLAPVLDHLWHGAAAGGRPVKWSDYMHSRETVLPVE